MMLETPVNLFQGAGNTPLYTMVLMVLETHYFGVRNFPELITVLETSPNVLLFLSESSSRSSYSSKVGPGFMFKQYDTVHT
jgi:hypothetical protein